VLHHRPVALPVSPIPGPDILVGTQAKASRVAGRGAHQMAELVGTALVADLTPVAAEAGAAEGDPRPVYTWAGPPGDEQGRVRSYLPSGGGAPRLVAAVGGAGASLCVWDTGPGALLATRQGPEPALGYTSLVTYQRASDGHPRIAAGTDGGLLCIWDGDDLGILHTIATNRGRPCGVCLAVYEEPTGGRTRLVTG
jgi:hypothetical protein